MWFDCARGGNEAKVLQLFPTTPSDLSAFEPGHGGPSDILLTRMHMQTQTRTNSPICLPTETLHAVHRGEPHVQGHRL